MCVHMDVVKQPLNKGEITFQNVKIPNSKRRKIVSLTEEPLVSGFTTGLAINVGSSDGC